MADTDPDRGDFCRSHAPSALIRAAVRAASPLGLRVQLTGDRGPYGPTPVRHVPDKPRMRYFTESGLWRCWNGIHCGKGRTMYEAWEHFAVNWRSGVP